MTVKVTLEFADAAAAVAFLQSGQLAAAPVTSADAPRPARATKVKPAATESAPPAAPAAPAATAPAAAAPAAAEAPTLKAVNDIVSKLAGKDRDAAVAILLAHGAAKVKTSTSQLKPEVYQVVIDETEEAIAKFDAAEVQVANSGSLV